MAKKCKIIFAILLVLTENYMHAMHCPDLPTKKGCAMTTAVEPYNSADADLMGKKLAAGDVNLFKAHPTEAEILMDVYMKKTKSRFYDHTYKPARGRYTFNIQADLLKAVEQYNRADCIQLLAMGAFLNTKLKDKSTLLHIAAKNGNSAFCEFLLRAKLCTVDAQNDNRDTPLSLAARQGWPAVCTLLIAHGANALHKDSKGKSLLLKCMVECTSEKEQRRSGIIKSCKLLQLCGADINEVDAEKSFIADRVYKRFGWRWIFGRVPVFMACGVDPLLQDNQGRTLFYRLYEQYQKDLQYRFNQTHEYESSFTKLLSSIIVHWHRYLEDKSVITLLTIKRFQPNNEFWGHVPRDVLRYCIIPHMCPFKFKDIRECGKIQVALMRKVLSKIPEAYKGEVPHYVLAPCVSSTYLPDFQKITDFLMHPPSANKAKAHPEWLTQQLL